MKYFFIYLVSKIMIHPHALLYSSQQDLTIGQLKNADYNPQVDTTLVQNWMKNHEINAIVEDDWIYFPKFEQIPSKPYIIYYQWNIQLLQKSLLWIVWPRKHSEFWSSMVQKIINQAIGYDIVTISWLAPGIDQLAHKYSLENNIPTIAVLWGGFRHYFRSKDNRLIRKIIDQWWLIISEFKLSQKPQSYTFPQRNRIIAGLADVLFLPEATKNSGSLITVDFAQKSQKPIYGPPNPESPMSDWLHTYLQKGIIRPLFDVPMMFSTHFSKNPTTSLNIYSKCSNFDLDTQNLLKYFSQNWSTTISMLIKNWFSQEKLYPSLVRLEMENLVYQSVPGIYTII